MPSKSRSNAKKRRSSSHGAANGSALEHLLPERGSAVFDIMGVCIIVVAIAMVLALVSPSNAPVTKAVGEFLVLCFGVGALLCPISLIIFAATLFLGEDEPIGHKVALGLFLIIVSILGMTSLTVPGTFYSKTGMKAAALRAAAFSEASLKMESRFVVTDAWFNLSVSVRSIPSKLVVVSDTDWVRFGVATALLSFT